MRTERMKITVDTIDMMKIYEPMRFQSQPMQRAVKIPPKANPKIFEQKLQAITNDLCSNINHFQAKQGPSGNTRDCPKPSKQVAATTQTYPKRLLTGKLVSATTCIQYEATVRKDPAMILQSSLHSMTFKAGKQNTISVTSPMQNVLFIYSSDTLQQLAKVDVLPQKNPNPMALANVTKENVIRLR